MHDTRAHENGQQRDLGLAHHGSVSKVERYRWKDPMKHGEMSWVDKNLLHVDERYQRELNDKKALQIASSFNWPAFGVLIVARRNGKLYVVDGQHRFTGALRRADVPKVPCIVFDSDGIAAEAQTFLDAQVLRKAVTAVDKFKAQLVTRDPIALRVQALIDQSGRTIAHGGSGPGTIACVALIYRLCQRTPETIERLWPVIVQICRGHQIQERIVDALVFIEERAPEGVSLTDKKWTLRLVNIGPEMLLRKCNEAAAFYAAGGAKVWASGVLQVLNRRLGESARFVLRGAHEETTEETGAE